MKIQEYFRIISLVNDYHYFCVLVFIWNTKNVTWANTIIKWTLMNTGHYLLNFLKVKSSILYDPDDQ